MLGKQTPGYLLC